MVSVERMVEYFNFVAHNNKLNTAKTINDILCKTYSTINIDKSHPFYNYLDKKYLTSEGTKLQCHDVIDTKELDFLGQMQEYKVLALINKFTMAEAPYILTELDNIIFRELLPNRNIDLVRRISSMVDSLYEKYLDYHRNTNELIFYKSIMNMSNNVFRCLIKKDHDTVSRYEKLVEKLLSIENINIYYLSRVVLVLKETANGMDFGRGIFESFKNINPGHYRSGLLNRVSDSDIINLIDDGYDLCSDILMQIKHCNENVLRGMILNNIGTETFGFNESELFDINYELYLITHHVKKNIKECLINKELRGLSLDLDGTAEIMLVEMGYFCVPVYTEDTNRRVLIAIDSLYKEVNLVMYDKGVVLVLLSEDDEYLRITDILQCPREDIDSCNKFKLKRLHRKQKTDDKLEICTEGINISKDGTLTFSYKVKKTYMDEYMSIHNVLIQNSKEKNLEGMKQNLVHIYLLLDKIEEERYKNKIKHSDDLLKARAFVINDFKTYLKQVQKSEPKFDFYEYLQKSDYSKVFINITPDNITGVKKIIKTLLL